MPDVNAVGYYLTNTTPGHNKFYRVIITDNGVVALTWGVIGKTGQGQIAKLTTFADAQDIGLKQKYAKAAKGYVEQLCEVKFKIPQDVTMRAFADNNPHALTIYFAEASKHHQFKGDQEAVSDQYQAFITRAQGILDRVGTAEFDVLYDEFSALEDAWRVINEQHNTAQSLIGVTRQKLMQSLIGAGD